jgi:hypothetical protein
MSRIGAVEEVAAGATSVVSAAPAAPVAPAIVAHAINNAVMVGLNVVLLR